MPTLRKYAVRFKATLLGAVQQMQQDNKRRRLNRNIMRYLTEEAYQDLVEKMMVLNDHGYEKSRRMAMGIALVLGKLEKTES